MSCAIVEIEDAGDGRVRVSLAFLPVFDGSPAQVAAIQALEHIQTDGSRKPSNAVETPGNRA